ncbi:MAG TPA: hypothetical protein VIV60_35780 [Polyangiaceae bacterium]
MGDASTLPEGDDTSDAGGWLLPTGSSMPTAVEREGCAVASVDVVPVALADAAGWTVVAIAVAVAGDDVVGAAELVDVDVDGLVVDCWAPCDSILELGCAAEIDESVKTTIVKEHRKGRESGLTAKRILIMEGAILHFAQPFEFVMWEYADPKRSEAASLVGTPLDGIRASFTERS